MSVQDMTPADLAAVMKDNDSFGNGNGWWIILLFLFMGWGGAGWGAPAAAAANAAIGGNELYPWLELQGSITNGFANVETAATNRQMANQQQMFDLSQQLSQIGCENRLALANLGADLAREACADRAAVTDGVRDIIANQNMNTQRIIDLMCQDKIDSKNEEIARLRQQLDMANLAASQIAQTTQIIDALKPAATA